MELNALKVGVTRAEPKQHLSLHGYLTLTGRSKFWESGSQHVAKCTRMLKNKFDRAENSK